jgi:uncharacterized protein (DUF849 family)
VRRNGVGGHAGENPAVPATPQQIAQSSIDAARAGASVVHIHVRDPLTTRPSMDGALYREVVDRIRSSGVDVLINLTTGPGARFAPAPTIRSDRARPPTSSRHRSAAMSRLQMSG